MRSPRKFQTGCRGATAVEFALVALPFVILMLGLIEFGRALHIKNSLSGAADMAQRQIIIDAAVTSTALTDGARASFLAGDPNNLQVVITDGASGGTNYRTVQLSYTMTLMIPIPAGGDVTLSTSRRVALDN